MIKSRQEKSTVLKTSLICEMCSSDPVVILVFNQVRAAVKAAGAARN